jgi:hypothetical protein
MYNTANQPKLITLITKYIAKVKAIVPELLESPDIVLHYYLHASNKNRIELIITYFLHCFRNIQEHEIKVLLFSNKR